MSSDPDVIQALASSGAAGLVMDFDGVLSPITDDPTLSELLPGTRDLLEGLAGRLRTVALLSGRPADFLAERATVPGVDLYGSYGLERWTPQGVEVLPEARTWLEAVTAATNELHRRLDDVHGIYVEDKSLAVAVHWRRAADQRAAEQMITPLIESAVRTHGLRREPGKCVEELRMPLEEDKGTALERIIRSNALGVVAYAGDDRGDLPAFAVASSTGGHPLVVDAADTAPEVLRVPGVHFDGPAQFQEWLRRLDRALT